ncbi:MAG: hypothetical protein HIU81_11015 [Acidobacteria bacterium]|nr:hypothetical protein [Acidobacteriota bacterium]
MEVPACGLSLSGLVQLDADKLAVVIKALADELQVRWLLDPGVDMAEYLDYVLKLLGSVSPVSQSLGKP